MKRDHTPGPWKFIGAFGTHDRRLAPFIRADHSFGALSVAQVTTSRKEWRANARLIASAPDAIGQLLLLRNILKREGWVPPRGYSLGPVDTILHSAGVIECAYCGVAEASHNPNCPRRSEHG